MAELVVVPVAVKPAGAAVQLYMAAGAPAGCVGVAVSVKLAPGSNVAGMEPAIDTLLIATVNEHSAVVLPSRPWCRLLSSDYMQVGAKVVRVDGPHLNRVGLPQGEQARLVKTVKVRVTWQG